MNRHLISVNGDCVGCGLCVSDCPLANIKIEDGKAEIIAQDCIECGHCVAVCPQKAVAMSGYDDEPQEISRIKLNPDQLLSAIKSRRSIRKFKSAPVSDIIINKVIDAGRYTPTAKNLQDVSYIVIRENIKEIEAVAVGTFRKIKKFFRFFYAPLRRHIPDDFFFKNAPVAIVILSETEINAALAASNMALTAEAFGLGVLYSGYFTIAANMRKLRKKLGIEKHRAVTTLVLGYADVKYCRTAQRETADVKYF